jgi:capsular polysaccharide biosynthesis protein
MEQQNREYDNEINLYDFWKVIAKRKKLIIGLFIVIVVSTAIVSLFMPKVYRGEINLSVMDNSASLNIDINNRNILIVKRAEDAKEIAKEIIDIMGSIDNGKKKLILPKTYISVKSVKLRALKEAKNKIVATIDAKSTDDIPVVISELVDFLNNMEFMKASLKEEREILTQRSIELSNILKTAPDLLVAYNKLIREGKLTTFGFNPIELNKRIVDIKIEKLAVEQALSSLKNGRIQIMTPPYISNKPVSPKILQNVFVAGIISLLLGVFLAILIEYIGNIKNKKSKPADNSLTD